MDSIYTIEEIQKRLLPVLQKNNVKKAILFGSYAKKKAETKSDIDLLVDSRLKGLAFIGFASELQDALQKNIDVFDVTHIMSGSDIEKEIDKSGVLLYER